jgi:subtilase family serine protease
LALKRSADRQAALDRLVTDQQTPGSPFYHRWVDAAELGSTFGPAPEDVTSVIAWLTRNGLTVNSVSPSGMTVDFAGTAGQVAQTFRTSLHVYELHGIVHTANAVEPAIPAALAPVVGGVVLHDFFPHPGAHLAGVAHEDKTTGTWSMLRPAAGFTTINIPPYGRFYAVAPADFATIYNINPVYQGAFDTGGPLRGAGQTIAVVDDSSFHVEDWMRFRSFFGLAGFGGTVSLDHPNCSDPGYALYESEAALDAEWSGAVAPDAHIIQSSCPSIGFVPGVLGAFENLIEFGTDAQIISVSYFYCERQLGPTFLRMWSDVAEMGAAEGLSIFVIAGDAGPAGCDDFNHAPYATTGTAVNGLAANPYVTSVGGTDFHDFALRELSTYWSGQNGPDHESALSYVPEIPWDDSCANPVIYRWRHGTDPISYCNSEDGKLFFDIIAGGGGPSEVYAKPDWQSLAVFGVPNDGARDQPDISLFAGNGTWGHFYVLCSSNPATGGAPCDYDDPNDLLVNAGGGTSFASPASRLWRRSSPR